MQITVAFIIMSIARRAPSNYASAIFMLSESETLGNDGFWAILDWDPWEMRVEWFGEFRVIACDARFEISFRCGHCGGTWIGIMVFVADMGWLLFGEGDLDIVFPFCVDIEATEELVLII